MMADLDKKKILPETDLPSGEELLNEGHKLQSHWTVGSNLFLREHAVANEIEYKNKAIRNRRLMQHAHLGYRSLEHTCEALKRIYDTCQEKDATVDRFGVCLDWSMGYPKESRAGKVTGTGLILNGPEDFQKLSDTVPSAMHFGDFMLGFPGALENTCAALSAGATTIGNLGQFFTFRLPNYTDDVETTANTVKALGLIAAQPVDVLVHSNLDDGFAAIFEDLTSALGMAILEKYIVTDLIGAKYAVCYGHHFTEPLTRIAFQRALSVVTDGVPGSQVFGATVLYEGDSAENYASLASYLLSDIVAQNTLPSGHAVNPVPVTENKRIPDVDEVIDAQLHLYRLSQLAEGYEPVFNFAAIDEICNQLVKGGRQFTENVLTGFKQAGFNCNDPFELLLALRRIGGRELERRFGIGPIPDKKPLRRQPVIPATTFTHLEEMATEYLETASAKGLFELGEKDFTILTATTDVHEHGKVFLDMIFANANLNVIDGGVSSDPEVIISLAKTHNAKAIAISTYNGVALRYTKSLLNEMKDQGINIPILVGGRLNEIPENSNTNLPTDVTQKIRELGAYPCADMEAASTILSQLS
ncbi:cobalamin-dependent protein [Curvivirga sp.]|uniref:cobalamin-dependent protein n=1 Tax=Curvivirga sp. TaxID=2856848 RepID=UPI003B5CD86C